jgi:uridine kinase
MTVGIKPFVVAVAGGSCSGKTTFAGRLLQEFGPEDCLLILQDDFYRDQSDKFDYDGGAINFDHPDAIDFDLMAQKVKDLKAGRSCGLPLYDFKSHSRLEKEKLVDPRPLIVVDGILILHPPQLVETFDYTLYFQEIPEVRFERRLKRDVIERGRTPEGVKRQFDSQVEPMHQKFVRPSRLKADKVIEGPIEEGDFHEIITFIKSKL